MFKKVHPLASAAVLLALAITSGIAAYAAKMHQVEQEMEVIRRQVQLELETSDRVHRAIRNTVK